MRPAKKTPWKAFGRLSTKRLRDRKRLGLFFEPGKENITILHDEKKLGCCYMTATGRWCLRDRVGLCGIFEQFKELKHYVEEKWL